LMNIDVKSMLIKLKKYLFCIDLMYIKIRKTKTKRVNNP
jgi:hypothetical protein